MNVRSRRILSQPAFSRSFSPGAWVQYDERKEPENTCLN
ncbi:hypothetical protein RRG08_059395, partial [Elysia crispata]